MVRPHINVTTTTLNAAGELSVVLTETYFGAVKDGVLVTDNKLCSSWILLPAENTWSNGSRGLLYLIGLIWCFLGIAIVADKFMDAIEYITSQKKSYEETDEKTGEKTKVQLEVWNPTVANLTLMALGSSAPEILLSVIETLMTIDETPGQLGPSTIVGSAAFNLLFISAVCIIAVDKPKKIYDYCVFSITAFSSVFAYLWMYICLVLITPAEITISEAALTFLMFPLLVIFAYLADAGYCCNKKSARGENDGDLSDRSKEDIDDLEIGDVGKGAVRVKFGGKAVSMVSHGKFENYTDSQEYKDDMKVLRGQALEKGFEDEAVETWVAEQLALKYDPAVKQSKSIAKGNVTGFLTGGKKSAMVGTDEQTRVQFVASKMEVNEGDASIDINIIRTGNPLNEAQVRVKTRDVKDCVAGKHYTPIDCVVTFEPGDRYSRKCVPLEVVDDEEYEPDRQLAMDLLEPTGKCKLGKIATTNITIVDDDHPGTFELGLTMTRIYEGDGVLRIPVNRVKGTKGVVNLKYKCNDGSGKGRPVDYEDDPNVPESERPQFNYWNSEGTLTFDVGEKQQFIEVKIINNEEVSDDSEFEVMIYEPEGGAELNSKAALCNVTIMDDDGYRKFVTAVLGKASRSMSLFGRDSDWTQQFREAMTPGGGGDDEEDDELAGCCEMVMHFITFGWKVIFSFVPPTHHCNGWAAFWVSLTMTGCVTAIVAELASLFGCSVGLADPVTAITLVALGTSLPDTFASMSVARSAEYADAAVGNVTGSNSVNVFLGLGLPWLMAVVIKSSRGEKYLVPAGTLGFSVFLFSITAMLAILLLFIKRFPACGGGELGGPPLIKWGSACILILLWLTYVTLSALQVYGVITAWV